MQNSLDAKSGFLLCTQNSRRRSLFSSSFVVQILPISLPRTENCSLNFALIHLKLKGSPFNRSHFGFFLASHSNYCGCFTPQKFACIISTKMLRYVRHTYYDTHIGGRVSNTKGQKPDRSFLQVPPVGKISQVSDPSLQKHVFQCIHVYMPIHRTQNRKT